MRMTWGRGDFRGGQGGKRISGGGACRSEGAEGAVTTQAPPGAGFHWPEVFGFGHQKLAAKKPVRPVAGRFWANYWWGPSWF